jgi:hypothetical protein
MAAAPWIVSDDLWGRVEPLLPMRERRFWASVRARRSLRGAGLAVVVQAGERALKVGLRPGRSACFA